MKKLTTKDLRQALTDASGIDSFLSDYEEAFLSEDVNVMLTKLFEGKNIPKAVLAKEAGISEVYLHQIFSGKRSPSRSRLLSICLALHASLDETQDLLQKCGYAPLYPRSRRDSIIMYALLHGQSPDTVNDLLFEHGEDPLF